MNPEIDLPYRRGSKPQTGPAIPHQQLSQIAPKGLQENLWNRMVKIAHITPGRSYISMPDTRALHLEKDNAHGPEGAFMIGTEFCHLHGKLDGSLHMTLPPEVAREVVVKGWGEIHPLARNSSDPTLMMVYGPRDEGELETVWQLVQHSYTYAHGSN